MKIAFFEAKEKKRLFFESHLKGHELFFFERSIQEVLTKPEEYEVISLGSYSLISDDILNKLPKLRYAQIRATGLDHLDINLLYKRDVMVSNVTGYAGPAVAEFAFSLLLNMTRKTHIALHRSQEENSNYLDLKGMELFGKTIGILGLGSIGLQMAKIAKGFGMDIFGYSRTKKPIFDELSIHHVSLEEVLKHADILMVALPLTPSTKNLVNELNSKLIKKESIIINISREEIIEKSLYYRLKNMIASDVSSDISLAQKENFFLTPHMGYYSQEALERILEISLQNLEQFLRGETPQNCLKP
ncbi:MAG: NAD(P)-binding domain-containing protein [Thiovulaceae bacterium]|nr:NAD(P)-binding domain-containing protein [Sulfurimonadaceae bacterium]